MASTEIKNERQSISQNSVRESMLPFVEGKKCHNYCCENCNSKNCSYTDFQNRSAYRSTTIVILCNDCGKTHNC